MRTVHETFYTVACYRTGEYRETKHFNDLASAVKDASRSSLYGEMIVSVHSTVENNPLETWANGSRFARYQTALEHMGVKTS